MKKSLFIFLLGIFSMFSVAAQTEIRGSVKDADSNLPIPDVTITINNPRHTPYTFGFKV